MLDKAQQDELTRMIRTSSPEVSKRLQIAVLSGNSYDEIVSTFSGYDESDFVIDMPPPPPAVIEQVDRQADPFAGWQPGMISPWDPEGFPKESFVDNISDVDRAAYLFTAGFTGKDLITMVAISMGENQTGDPWARGPYSAYDNTGENEGKWQRALGLQQIRPLTNPQDYSGDEWRDYAQLLDPQYNADAAWTEFMQKKGFGGWKVYNDNIHLQFMDRARQAVESLNQTLGREE